MVNKIFIISEVGTVTVPKNLRDKYGLQIGSVVCWKDEKGKLILKPMQLGEKQ